MTLALDATACRFQKMEEATLANVFCSEICKGMILLFIKPQSLHLKKNPGFRAIQQEPFLDFADITPTRDDARGPNFAIWQQNRKVRLALYRKLKNTQDMAQMFTFLHMHHHIIYRFSSLLITENICRGIERRLSNRPIRRKLHWTKTQLNFYTKSFGSVYCTTGTSLAD